MRLSTDESRDEELALETIAAAAEAGVTVFDTARAYGRQRAARSHERCCAAAAPTATRADRDEGRHDADRRRLGPRRSREGDPRRLRGEPRGARRPADRPLPIHAPDPRTPWRTSVRALARLVGRGLVRRVGLANVNRRQLDEALELAPVAAVQVALSPFDDRALRGGVVERCDELGIAVIAHSPLGGPRRAGGSPTQALAEVAAGTTRLRPRSRSRGCSSSRRSSSRSPARGGRRRRARPRARRRSTRRRRPGARALRPAVRLAPSAARRADGEVVLVMGFPGAGKSRVAAELRRARLPPAQPRRARRLAARARRRARRGALVRRPAGRPRQHVPHARGAELRDRGGEPARRSRCGASGSTRRSPRRRSTSSSGCSTASARSRRPESCGRWRSVEPGVLAPTSQMRALRELEPPSTDEGFAGVEHVPFVRAAVVRRRGRASSSPPPRSAESGWDARRSAIAPHLVFDWSPDGSPDALRRGRRPPRGRGLRAGRGRALPARRPARRPAGAGRRFPGCRSRSRERTASTRRARCSSEPARRTGRSRRRSAPATSRSDSQQLRDQRRRSRRAVRLDRPVVDLAPDLVGDRVARSSPAVAVSKSMQRPAP